ncbi:hypothetical protein [Vandammella animalimorsus]|uniref:Uncharacterized protein n=1 Tax=Vandammella animalimorsus TaxID=2029117 RepID=A0A2A2A8W3_9BURK|nr:hypothetical protein [Vandammella animalimorsus]PAT34970.1 hypothetical protein CK625_12705 [Vandammella animalimorsus]
MSWTPAPETIAARSQALIDRADAGSGHSTIEIYDASSPAPVRLCVLVLDKPCGQVINNLVRLKQKEAAGDFVDFDGQPATCKWLDGNGHLVATGTVSGPDGDGDLRMRNRLGTAQMWAGGRAVLDTEHLIG